MRDVVLILLSACIAALPFVAFRTQVRDTPVHQATSQWGSDLRQTSPGHAMPGVIPAAATSVR